MALSRARLGLYILGRRSVFDSCYELKEAFDRLLQRPTTLMVVPGEMHPSTRALEDETTATEMTGVEHLGQYVYEMTQAKIKQLEAGEIALPAIEEDVAAAEEEAIEETNDVVEEVEDVDGVDGEDAHAEALDI